MTDTSVYLSLFLSGFIAATLVPAQSELGLGYLVINTDFSIVLLVIVASLGNTAGSILNWIIGCGIANSAIRYEKTQALPRYLSVMKWYKKFGHWTLLLSWMPIIGDPITLIAGVFNVPFKYFLTLVTIAKTLRYIFVALIAKKFGFG